MQHESLWLHHAPDEGLQRTRSGHKFNGVELGPANQSLGEHPADLNATLSDDDAGRKDAVTHPRGDRDARCGDDSNDDHRVA